MPDQNFPTQTKTKSKTKLIVGLIISVIALIGIGTGILYFSGIWEPGEHKIDLSRAFSAPEQGKSDPYMVYKSEEGKEGVRLDTEEFVNQIDTPSSNPFSAAQGVFPNCEAIKSLKEIEALKGMATIDFSNIFISFSDDPKKEDKITDPITINFTDLSKNKIYPKMKMQFTEKFFEEVEKQIKQQASGAQEAIKKTLEEKLNDPTLSEEAKKAIRSYLQLLANQIPANIFSEEQKGEFEKLKQEGFTFYLSLNDLQTNHLVEARYQYDPRYILVRNGEIFPLAPTEKAGVSLKAKLCDGIETQEIKVEIPKRDFQAFEPKKTGDITSKETNFGAYDPGFLIGKTQSQPILKDEINKISEKKYITKASLNVKTLHHTNTDGKMEIYLSPDGGLTWIAPNETEPQINYPKDVEWNRSQYAPKEDTFTYDFKKELQPQDLRMIVVAQNKNITGGSQNLTAENWNTALTEAKGEFLEKKNLNVKTDSGFVGQKTFFITQGKDAEIQVKKSDETPLSSFEMVSKFDGGMKQTDNKIDAIAAQPFYTQILFKEKSGKTPIISISLVIKPDASKTDFANSVDMVSISKEIAKNVQDKTQEVQNGVIPSGKIDPTEIKQRINQLEQASISLKQVWPKDPANLVSQKSQVEQLNTNVVELKNDFNARKILDSAISDKLNQIENTLNTLDNALKETQKISWLEKNKLALFRNYFVKEVKAENKLNIGITGGPLSNSIVFSAVVLPYSTPILNEASIKFETEEKLIVAPPTSSVLESLDINPVPWYRGHSRVIVKWNFTSGATNNVDPNNISFKYGESENAINKGAKVYKDKNDGKYYVVLRDLKGGEWSDKNDQGFQNGRFPYYYQVEVGGKSVVKNFKTLNRMQTIGYYYTLVLDRDYLKDQSETNLTKWESRDSIFTGKKVKDLEAGGPGFFYKPQDKEPLTLLGIKFTMVNDRMAKEFDNKLFAQNKNQGTKEAVQTLYRKIHDRIYDEDLGKFFDTKGVEYWALHADKKITGKDAIDIFGVKFALSVSKEYQNELFGGIGQASAKPELAYQIVLKRGADKEGLDYLKKSFGTAKEMRKHLAESKEYNDRIAAIEKEFSRNAAISEMYETLYGRAADIDGVNYWDKSKLSFDILKQKFISSNEFTKVIKE